MTAKKTFVQEDWITAYMDYCLGEGEAPSSVYSLTKMHKRKEHEFYQYFGSFEALEASVFTRLFDRSLELLTSNDDYREMDSRNKLLSLYFTFFENLTANRSFILFLLEKRYAGIRSLAFLKPLEKYFKEYVDELEIETMDLKNKNAAHIQNRAIRDAAWVQFLSILRFWVRDTSANFEKTDVFIEKSVHAGFDLVNIQPVRSVMDWGKFVFKEVSNRS